MSTTCSRFVCEMDWFRAQTWMQCGCFLSGFPASGVELESLRYGSGPPKTCFKTDRSVLGVQDLYSL